ncbi:MAG: type III polyketide synthase [Allosphingosinicella sp.]|uniref:type III polyketide synthase n=1 Tax=Allosphingosinicella sp. TaxID=2823234 RepID=UPI003926794C
MSSKGAYINAVAGAVPDHDIHQAYVDWARAQITDRRLKLLFERMAERSGIEHRWSVLPPAPGGGSPVDPGGFYAERMPGTAERMKLYAEAAPDLAMAAIGRLREQIALGAITHLVVASCTGFVAPGVDQIIAARMGLGDVERTLVGFMGCYAAVAALRTAFHIVRSEPGARVLVVTVELSSLHLQPMTEPEPLLAGLQFGDGAAAALVTAEQKGFEMKAQFNATLPESEALIGWTIGDTGFEMTLSGEVPGRIGAALHEPHVRSRLLDGWSVADVDAWAVHAGGRSILDAVERGLELAPDALDSSRRILADFGNMSSSTLMFVLADLLERPDKRRGVAIAFGPGLAAEGFRFERAG